MTLKCKRCGKQPEQIAEYVAAAREESLTPDDFVREEEGTFNPKTGLFWCTSCYIALGQPLCRA